VVRYSGRATSDVRPDGGGKFAVEAGWPLQDAALAGRDSLEQAQDVLVFGGYLDADEHLVLLGVDVPVSA
jgi:hypothetical protein